MTEFAENYQLKASHFTAIGAFHEALFGCFDGEKKADKKIPITQQVEVISLVGDIGLINGNLWSMLTVWLIYPTAPRGAATS